MRRVNRDGSSPQVRGTPIIEFRESLRVRFIPAGAGNTPLIILFHPMPPVHPRRCGEHIESRIRVVSAAGSSPQVRGTRTDRRLYGLLFAVHPRRCGKHASRPQFGCTLFGSSPQVRGTLLDRLIAGAPSLVHPRRCGEHVRILHDPPFNYGSSPQVRGTRRDGE